MTHPDAFDPVQQRRLAFNLNVARAVFSFGSRHHLSAQVPGHKLHPIADTKDWNAKVVDSLITSRRALLVDGVRTAGKYDSTGRVLTNDFKRCVERHDLRVHVRFANPPSNQLRVLGTEIEDKNGFKRGRHYASLYQSPNCARRPCNSARPTKSSRRKDRTLLPDQCLLFAAARQRRSPEE